MKPGSSDDLNELLATVQNDTWTGISSVTVTPAPASPLASVIMAFKVDPSATAPALQLTSADSQISIINAATWTFSVPPQTITLAPGIWYWQIQTTSAAGKVYTYTQGTMEVLNDYTTTP